MRKFLKKEYNGLKNHVSEENQQQCIHMSTYVLIVSDALAIH